ncbi:uncharacterized protein G6M90_00g094030 [Metarhizium brunneum]|uniref:Uncharacterized protein n=1 Tax=Metarhizium brunneum TaxID=500148 RepID=A0A7D5Z6K3_9HYPO
MGTDPLTAFSAMNTAVPNPKQDHNLFRCSLDIAPACFATGKPCKGILSMASTMDIEEMGNGRQAAELLRLMGNSFQEKDNCGERFIFGYHHKFAAGIYLGSGLGKQTAELSLNTMADRLQLNSKAPNHTTAEHFSSELQAEEPFGISIDTTGDLAAVQRAVLEWREGICATSNKILRPT